MSTCAYARVTRTASAASDDPPHWTAWQRTYWFESVAAPQWLVDLIQLTAVLTLFFGVLIALLANG